MELVHIDLDQTDPIERGRAHGRFLGAHVRRAAEAYTRYFERVGLQKAWLDELAEGTIRVLDSWRPDLAAELRGIADGSDVPLRDIALLNARTEALANAVEQHECSTVAVTHPDRSPLGAQTWDWHATLAQVGVISRITLASGRRIATFAEAGTLAKIGVSDAGLSLHFNILHHVEDGGTEGVPVHAVARAILEEATTLAEAVAIAESAPLTASTVCTVLSRADRDARCIELSPAGIGVVSPTPTEEYSNRDGENGGTSVLLHTNHFLHDRLAPGNVADPQSSTHARIDFLAERSVQLASATTPATLVNAMCGGSADAAVCMRPQQDLAPDDQWETLLTIATDVDRGSITCVPATPDRFSEAEEWIA